MSMDKICQAATCDDGVKNGGESDVDCGGPDCGGCDPGASCGGQDDCASGVCQSGACAAPSCSDGVENGQETDTDCGGPDCSACSTGQSCQKDGDCQSNICKNNTCVECKNGETRTISRGCGYQNRGQLQQVCTNNTWERKGCQGDWYETCDEIYQHKNSPSSGTYTIDPEGPGQGVDAFKVRCEMKKNHGWLELVPWPNSDHVYATAVESGNEFSKCGGDQLQDIDGISEGQASIDDTGRGTSTE